MAAYAQGIGTAVKKTKQRSSKSLQTTCTSLCYSNAKSAVKVPLTFNKVEKTKVENFDFVNLSSSFSSTRITRKVYGVCEF